MALSDQERADIRKFLGWPDRFNTTLNSQLDQALNAVSSESETNIRAELVKLEATDTKLGTASTYFPASQVGTIGVEGAQNLELLRDQGRQAAGRIAAILGVEVRHDAFAGTGPAPSAGNFLMGI
jgi:hypothetical protein